MKTREAEARKLCETLIVLKTLSGTDSSDGLHEIDAQLVEDEIVPQPEKKRSRQHAKNVSWLRKTEYISTEYNRFQTSSENPETK